MILEEVMNMHSDFAFWGFGLWHWAVGALIWVLLALGIVALVRIIAGK